jgi:hypothetical protein
MVGRHKVNYKTHDADVCTRTISAVHPWTVIIEAMEAIILNTENIEKPNLRGARATANR